MSPDPCHFASSTSAFSNSPESRAGRNRFKPVLVRISDLSRARGKINRCGVIPVSASIIGRANSSKVTMVDTGFPGSPKKYFLCGVDTPFDSLRSLRASSVRADGEAAAGTRAGAPAPQEPNTIGRPKKYFLCGVDTPFDSLRSLRASSVRADGEAAAG